MRSNKNCLQNEMKHRNQESTQTSPNRMPGVAPSEHQAMARHSNGTARSQRMVTPAAVSVEDWSIRARSRAVPGRRPSQSTAAGKAIAFPASLVIPVTRGRPGSYFDINE